MSNAYDSVFRDASPADVAVGSTSDRLHGLAGRSTAFDRLYLYPPLLAACRSVIGHSFRLSSFLARTVRPHVPEQALHADIGPAEDRSSLLGFIFMIDPFREDNGATRFVPGSHVGPHAPQDLVASTEANAEPVLAKGEAGSLIIYYGSIRHGHSSNRTGRSRRSIQGAYIRNSGTKYEML